jgi:EthD domain
MLKVMTLFLKRPDLTRRQFRDYYEGHHVAMGLAANKYFGFTKYVRNHVVAASPSAPARPFAEFDCFSEYTFRDVDAAVEAQKFMLTPGGKALAEDELNFLDMSYHPSFGSSETLIAGVPRRVDVGITPKWALVLARGEGIGAAEFLSSIEAFARGFAQQRPETFVRLVLDAPLDGPAGRPPFDAILSLWPTPGLTQAPVEFRWPQARDRALVLALESLEAAPETLGL